MINKGFGKIRLNQKELTELTRFWGVGKNIYNKISVLDFTRFSVSKMQNRVKSICNKISVLILPDFFTPKGGEKKWGFFFYPGFGREFF